MAGGLGGDSSFGAGGGGGDGLQMSGTLVNITVNGANAIGGAGNSPTSAAGGGSGGDAINMGGSNLGSISLLFTGSIAGGSG